MRGDLPGKWLYRRHPGDHPAALRRGNGAASREFSDHLPVGAPQGEGNTFVHRLSSRTARHLFIMDADILLYQRSSLWNMLSVLSQSEEAWISTDHPVKDITLRRGLKVLGGLSAAAGKVQKVSETQLTGQLYCIRSDVARRIYLPRNLASCDDGFIKWIVCTDFLTRSARFDRIVCASNASHVFEAYTSVLDVIRNQKRQALGQTMVHLLVDKFLRTLSIGQRRNLAETLRRLDQNDPDWLRQLVGEHLRQIRFYWQLYPQLLGSRFQLVRRSRGLRRLKLLLPTLASFCTTNIGSFLAFRALKRGCIGYWPDTRSLRLRDLPIGSPIPTLGKAHIK
jgi:hypothetical protein